MDYVLVTEGGDDRMLNAPIEWLLEQHCEAPFSGEWANPGALEDPSRDLSIRLAQVQRFYPADLYFVHRDTDTFDRARRLGEINDAVRACGFFKPYVCAIPVRMTEAWFLFSEPAIRKASGRGQGQVQLRLPTAAEAERRADPKLILEEKLVLASELSGRKLAQFRSDMGRRKSLVATGIEDFSPLRQHQSFRSFEADLVAALVAGGWA
ncbi:hypothetical protein [Pseudoxanthomonas mexicana]|uniref:hypothetical protein n=1 Tax=Pseudoxanthomonas mexicana TaxID=128785 RepID=UPI001FD6E055|nr:hypothetical protein [Pseudoxanthomonas mexicana]UOV01497.1 hypothetical protein MUU73_16345 [Pseudoxanthomonas mexicana]